MPGFDRFAPDDRRQRLAATLRSDPRLKRVLLGAVLGLMTGDELAFALGRQAEVRRRVATLLTERVLDQADRV